MSEIRWLRQKLDQDVFDYQALVSALGTYASNKIGNLVRFILRIKVADHA